MSSPSPSLAYRPEIDGIRAIAVLAVVAYHADASLLPGGFVGVDVFFVISGYLITAMLASEHRRTGRIDLPSFWARRARRILPALLVLVAVVSAASAIFLSRHGAVFEAIAPSALASLAFVANFWFEARSGGYFDASADSMPLLHLWSLAVEEQYYLVYPLLLAALLRWVPDGPRRRVALFAVASLLLAEYWVHIEPERAFYQMPARFWELAAGALVALSPVPVSSGRVSRMLVPAGIAIVAAACVLTPAWGTFPALGAVPAVAGTAVALLGIHRGAVSGLVASGLRAPPAVAVGLLSYSLYLWHWPLLVVVDQLRWDPMPTAARLALCVVALGIAWASWRYVERPVRALPAGAARTLAGAGLAVAACAIVVLVAATADGVPPESRALADRAKRDWPTQLRCHLPSDEPIGRDVSLAACSSVPGRTPRIVIWGDSHAMAWRPLAWELAARDGGPVAGLTMNSCQPSGRPQDADRQPCADLNALALRELSTAPVDTVILSMRWPLWEHSRSLDDRIAGLHALLPRLRHVRRIVLIGPLPMLRRSAPDCIQLGWIDQCAMSRRAFDEARAPVWEALAPLPDRYPNLELVDPVAYFCDATECPVLRDGVPQYWDKGHITATAATAFTAEWRADPARYVRTPAPRDPR